MFKVPDWGEDVPKVKVDFDKKSKKSKLQTSSENKSPLNGIKKKKLKNKKHTNQENTKFSTTINNGKGPSFVSTKINGAVNKNKFKNNVSVNNKKATFNASNNEITKNKKVKLNKNSNKSEMNVANDNKNLSRNDSQNAPRKGKKRKKSLSKNDEEQNNEINEGIKTKKKKSDDNFKIDDKEDFLFGHNNKSKNKTKVKNDTTPIKVYGKKERLKQVLETQLQRNPVKTSGNKLRDRMLERLKAAQFRYINEKLYTSSGSDAQQLFQNDPTAFQTYHEGYQQQVKKWPVNPLDVIVKRIQKMPKTSTIADMGCGEGALYKRIPHTVRSFDLVATSPGVEVCDVAHTPLLSESMDVAVYCLALMGTELTQYLVEANRVLKVGGHLLIAEVESRFNKVEDFTKEVERLGFKLKNLDKTHQVFFFMEFTKIRDPPVKKSKLPALTLKPCLYKRR